MSVVLDKFLSGEICRIHNYGKDIKGVDNSCSSSSSSYDSVDSTKDHARKFSSNLSESSSTCPSSIIAKGYDRSESLTSTYSIFFPVDDDVSNQTIYQEINDFSSCDDDDEEETDDKIDNVQLVSIKRNIDLIKEKTRFLSLSEKGISPKTSNNSNKRITSWLESSKKRFIKWKSGKISKFHRGKKEKRNKKSLITAIDLEKKSIPIRNNCLLPICGNDHQQSSMFEPRSTLNCDKCLIGSHRKSNETNVKDFECKKKSVCSLLENLLESQTVSLNENDKCGINISDEIQLNKRFKEDFYENRKHLDDINTEIAPSSDEDDEKEDFLKNEQQVKNIKKNSDRIDTMRIPVKINEEFHRYCLSKGKNQMKKKTTEELLEMLIELQSEYNNYIHEIATTLKNNSNEHPDSFSNHLANALKGIINFKSTSNTNKNSNNISDDDDENKANNLSLMSNQTKLNPSNFWSNLTNLLFANLIYQPSYHLFSFLCRSFPFSNNQEDRKILSEELREEKVAPINILEESEVELERNNENISNLLNSNKIDSFQSAISPKLRSLLNRASESTTVRRFLSFVSITARLAYVNDVPLDCLKEIYAEFANNDDNLRQLFFN
ncbi:hypothetical protein SNEBB_002706 [Seison nebaliae]|nr:hypothetical protein SNEBB_002706 [Seison nebaliae]